MLVLDKLTINSKLVIPHIAYLKIVVLKYQIQTYEYMS